MRILIAIIAACIASPTLAGQAEYDRDAAIAKKDVATCKKNVDREYKEVLQRLRAADKTGKAPAPTKGKKK
jgi:hypothetical protein